MDDLKLFYKSGKRIGTLVRAVHVSTTDIGIGFVMKKYGILTLKTGKWKESISEGIQMNISEAFDWP